MTGAHHTSIGRRWKRQYLHLLGQEDACCDESATLTAAAVPRAALPMEFLPIAGMASGWRRGIQRLVDTMQAPEYSDSGIRRGPVTLPLPDHSR